MSKTKRTPSQMCEACTFHGKTLCAPMDGPERCVYNEFIRSGYHLAEQDLALTRDDVRDIVAIADAMMEESDGEVHDEAEYPPSWRLSAQSYYEEVLRRYNALMEARP